MFGWPWESCDKKQEIIKSDELFKYSYHEKIYGFQIWIDCIRYLYSFQVYSRWVIWSRGHFRSNKGTNTFFTLLKSQIFFKKLQKSHIIDYFFKIDAYLKAIETDVVDGTRFYKLEMEKKEPKSDLEKKQNDFNSQCLMQIELINSILQLAKQWCHWWRHTLPPCLQHVPDWIF